MSKYLLDTNIVSETLRKTPNKQVLKWLEAVPSDTLFISVLTLGEIRKGIEKLILSKRKNQLNLWIEHELPKWFGKNVLPVSQSVADRWGYLCANSSRPLSAIDSLLAATALTHDLKLVTRNVQDFEFPSLEIINPLE